MATSEPDEHGPDAADEAADSPDDELDLEELEARMELLEAENRRLRGAVSDAKRSNYRRAAAGHGILGALALAGGFLFPDARAVLFALGGTGLFIGLLTYYLTPERFIAASVGERVYGALANTLADATTELGLSPGRVYVPGESGVRLYVPQRDTDAIPDDDALDSTFVVGEDPPVRGLATDPTGRPLYEEFRQARSGPEPTTAADAAAQLRDGLLEVFEFGDAATVDVETGDDGGRLSLELTEPVYGAGDRFDNPAVSLVAVGLADALDRPVRVDVSDGAPLVATFRWDAERED